MSLIDEIDKSRVPAHISIIMDGNGRWAKQRGLDRSDGHREGSKSIRRLINASIEASIEYVTVYAFSTENWNRPSDEVSGLMSLMVYTIKEETPFLIEKGVKLLSIGDKGRLPEDARKSLEECEEVTKDGKNITLIIALSYSSRWEITNAAKSIGRDLLSGVMTIDDINEEAISGKLTTNGIPDPDLLIRTGGEQRISNFLLWQSAYTELYFTDTFWPDFDDEDLYKAIIDFQGRERRFGKTSEQLQ